MPDSRKVKAIKIEVAVFLIEMPCPEKNCHGTFQRDLFLVGQFEDGKFEDKRPLIAHVCSICGKTAYLKGKYPHLEYQKLPVTPITHETEVEDIG